MKTPKMVIRKSGLVFLLGLLSLNSCKKDDEPDPLPAEQQLVIRFGYEVDGEALQASQLIYTNEAGNEYSVHTLKYYLSGFAFRMKDGTWKYSDAIVYADAFSNNWKEVMLKGIPAGNYDAFRVVIGLEPQNNESNSLPATVENLNMIWPEPMGGGYHFLKLEGNFLDQSQLTKGYAMHIGKSGFHSECEVAGDFTIETGKDTLNLNMNIAEWFRTPHTYDFNINGNYSMGKDSSMLKLKENGEDVFTLE